MDFGSDGKESAYNAGDLSSVLGSGRFPRGENGNPLQYSFLENSIVLGAWWATYTSWGCKESDITEKLTLSFHLK